MIGRPLQLRCNYQLRLVEAGGGSGCPKSRAILSEFKSSKLRSGYICHVTKNSPVPSHCRFAVHFTLIESGRCGRWHLAIYQLLN